VPDHTNGFVPDWKQVPAAMFQESLPKRVEAVIAGKEGPSPYWNEMFTHVVYLKDMWVFGNGISRHKAMFLKLT
jgi:hypothetical protein